MSDHRPTRATRPCPALWPTLRDRAALAAASTVIPVKTPNPVQPATGAVNAIAATARNAPPMTNRLSRANRGLSFMTSTSWHRHLAMPTVSYGGSGRAPYRCPGRLVGPPIPFGKTTAFKQGAIAIHARGQCLLDHTAAALRSARAAGASAWEDERGERQERRLARTRDRLRASRGGTAYCRAAAPLRSAGGGGGRQPGRAARPRTDRLGDTAYRGQLPRGADARRGWPGR